MRLHEEYLKRHNLDVPLVCYDHRSTVFLYGIDAPMWRIMSLAWRHPETWHPGFFEMSYCAPMHNGRASDGHFSSGLVQNLCRPRKWYWDTYEESLLKFVSEVQKEFRAIPHQDCKLASWQMFLYMCDARLASLRDRPLFFNRIEESLRSSDASERLIAQGKVLHQLQGCMPEVFDIWTHQVEPLTANYSEWLVELING